MINPNNIVSRIISHRHFNWIAAGFIALLVLIAYSNTFTASFHFDDDAAISENHVIKQATANNIFQLIRGARPVVALSLMLNYQIGGLNPVGWHVFNILVHIINAFLVYLFILTTLSLPSLSAYREKAKRMALFGALLFGVHPIQTESVTYIISRSELLATCFYLMTFLFLIKQAATGKLRYAAAMLVTAVLSMGSKQWAVTLPALLLIYDFLFLAEGKVQKVFSRWYLYILTAVPSFIVFSTLDLTSPGGAAGVGFNLVSTSGITPKNYFLTSLNVLWTYIRLLFLPINQNLDYDYKVAKTLFEFPTFLSLAGHVAVTGSCFWLYFKKGWKLIPFGAAWFYIGISPVQSIVPVIDVIFEHRLYMPSVGFFLLFIVGFEMVFDWIGTRYAKQGEAGTVSGV